MDRADVDVTRYLDGLVHCRRDDVMHLRQALLDGVPELEESVKWNAPNFRYAGEDRVTFRLQPRERFQLVLHRGAKVRADAAAFRFEDPTGTLEWAAPDRAVHTVPEPLEPGDVAAVVDLVARWVRA